MRLITGYHRSVWWWMSVTCGALAIAVALAVLMVGTSAPASVQLTRSVPGTGAARSYDIIVSAPAAGGAGDSGGWTAKPAALDGRSGGITLAQYNAIRKLAGVAVAAPLTMVGYVPFTVSAPMAIPATVRAAGPAGVTLTVRLRSDNGLSTVTWDDVTVAYPTVKPSTMSVKLNHRAMKDRPRAIAHPSTFSAQRSGFQRDHQHPPNRSNQPHDQKWLDDHQFV